MHDSIALRPLAAAQARLSAAGWRGKLAAGALIVATSLALRQNGATPDVAWLTSMCARMLDGERGWVDIFETTPPVPTLLYMPGAALSRLAGVGVEFATFAIAYAAAIFVTLWTRTILKRAGAQTEVDLYFTLPALFFFLIASNDAFAQREWYGALLSLPMASAFIARISTGPWPPLAWRFLAAILAGLSFAIKPPLFAAPFVVLGALEVVRTRSLAFLFPSMLPLAALFGVGVTALSLALYPEYLRDVAPLMRDIYVPSRLGLYNALTTIFIATLALTVIGGAAAHRNQGAGAGIYAAMSATHVAIYLAQGKFFDYHLAPAAAFALLGVAEASRLESGRRRLGLVIAGMIGAIAIGVALDDGRARRGDYVWASSLRSPTMMAISPDISTGFPLTLHVGGRWIDRIHGQWVVNYATYALERGVDDPTQRATYERWRDSELERTRTLIRDKKPDIILQNGGKAWLTEALLAPDSALLDDYEEIAVENGVRILKRKD